MGNEIKLLLYSLLILSIFPSKTHSKSVIEPCYSSHSCTSLLSYRLPWDSKVSEIAFRFQLKIPDILAFNSIDPTSPPSWNQIFPSKSLLKIPISCPCVDGIRRAVSTFYTVQSADTLDSISEGYGGLVSVEQIRSFNGMNMKSSVMNGQSLLIPLPCTCFNNSNNGGTSVYMSYVVERDESLMSIGAKYGTTVRELQGINSLQQPQVDPGDIIAVPIPACSSESLNWRNDSVIVPNGSVVLTANNCIKCGCVPSDLTLQCSPSALISSCSHLQCQGSNLFIGSAYENKTEFGCNVTSCVYRGYSGHKIFRSLINSTQMQCSANQSHARESPYFPPSSTNSALPETTLPPSLSPTSTSIYTQPMGIYAPNPKNAHIRNISSNRRLFSQASCLGLLVLELVFSLFF